MKGRGNKRAATGESCVDQVVVAQNFPPSVAPAEGGIDDALIFHSKLSRHADDGLAGRG
jgi:hypothetical protein